MILKLPQGENHDIKEYIGSSKAERGISPSQEGGGSEIFQAKKFMGIQIPILAKFLFCPKKKVRGLMHLLILLAKNVVFGIYFGIRRPKGGVI